VAVGQQKSVTTELSRKLFSKIKILLLKS